MPVTFVKKKIFLGFNYRANNVYKIKEVALIPMDRYDSIVKQYDSKKFEYYNNAKQIEEETNYQIKKLESKREEKIGRLKEPSLESLILKGIEGHKIKIAELVTTEEIQSKSKTSDCCTV
jgi:hypothetical protein